ncbi:MAG: hypothetical protein LAQ69_52425, partial [Acidobacteriia bacterium]|nr:hypothetical protein [Terriglobia bacterium]
IAVNAFREAFFVGTTTATTGGGQQASATATIVAPNNGLSITLTNAGSGYTPAGGILTVLFNALPPNPLVCAIPPDVQANINADGTVSLQINNVGLGCSGNPNPVFIPPPIGGLGTFTLTTSPLQLSVLPTPPTQNGLGGSTGTVNASATPQAFEDVIYGAIQFYDFIATPGTLNFTTTVNGPTPTRQLLTMTNWQGQPITIPPGCTIVPAVVGDATNSAGIMQNAEFETPAEDFTHAMFTVTQVGVTPVWQVIPTANAIANPGVWTAVWKFNPSAGCAGGGGQPFIDKVDPAVFTLTVTAPLDAIPTNTFVVHSKVASGIVDEYLAGGTQSVANEFLQFPIGVTTSSGTVNFTVQLVGGTNWNATNAVNCVTLPFPADTVFGTLAPNQNLIPVNVSTSCIASLPIGEYQASIVIVSSPETPNNGVTPPPIPIDITITPGALANNPITVVFGSSQTPQQTSLTLSNPVGTAGPFQFTGVYLPNPNFGTALPAANISFPGSPTITGTIPVGGQLAIPVQINPANLTTGVYSGIIQISGAGQAATALQGTLPFPQTTVPIIVYVGPATGTRLGLMLPPNSPTFITSPNSPPSCTTAAAINPPGGPPSPGTPGQLPTNGAYPLVFCLAAGMAAPQLPGQPPVIQPSPANTPIVLQVTGLNNTSLTPVTAGAPAFAVTSGPLNGGAFPAGVFTIALLTGNQTWAQQSALPLSPLGPVVQWGLAINTTNLPAGTYGGTITFGATGGLAPTSSMVVPFTLNVTNFPQLAVTQPQFFPNPTFGPGIPQNPIPGFFQTILGVPLPANGVQLTATISNSTPACMVVDLNATSGTFGPGFGNGGVNNVTIAPLTVPWLFLAAAPAAFDGHIPQFGTNGGVFGRLAPLAVPGSAFAAGPTNVGTGLQTFQICADASRLSDVVGTVHTTSITVNGAGVGSVTVPVTLTTLAEPEPPPTSCTFTVTNGVALTNAVQSTGTPVSQAASFTVTPGAACTAANAWVATSGAYWVQIVSGGTGTGGGPGTVNILGLSNTLTTARSTSVTISPSVANAFAPIAVNVTQVASTAPLLQRQVTAL